MSRKDEIYIILLKETDVVKLHMIFIIIIICTFFLLSVFFYLFYFKIAFSETRLFKFSKEIEREEGRESRGESQFEELLALKRQGNFRRRGREGMFNLFLSGVIVLHVF